MKVKTFLNDFDSIESCICIHTPEGSKIFEYTSDAIDFFGDRKIAVWDASVTTEGQPQVEIWV